MSKKLITVLLTVLTVMILTGCNTDKKAVTETAEGFLNAMVSNDMKAASQFATEDFMNSKTMKLMDPEYLADTFYAAMGVEKEDMGEEAQKAVDEYVRKVISKAYKSFEIQDTKVMEETAAVTAKITLGYDPGASSGQSEETLDLIKQYQSEHYDELIAIYTEDGQKAMYNKIYNDLIPLVIGKMQEALENSEPSEEKSVLTLVKTDGKWLVSDLEENRGQAGTGNTSEEAAAAVSTAGDSEIAAEDETSAENEISEENEIFADEDSAGDGTDESAAQDSTSEEYAAQDNTSEESAAQDSMEEE